MCRVSSPLLETETITSRGMSRTFIVHIPPSGKVTGPLPVIFDFHPLGGTGASQESASGWGTKCDSVGCIAVFPNSATNGGNGWNVGYCCQGAQSNKVDDVQFTRDMIKWLAANTCVDPRRIYASGCSNGGGMSYMLACKAADVIAAVAPVDFRCITGAEPANASQLTATNNTACTCTLPRPISVTAFDEGQDNSVVPYDGGNTVVAADCAPGGSCKAFPFPSAQVNVDTWAHFDMCTGSATTLSTNSICKTYMSCADSRTGGSRDGMATTERSSRARKTEASGPRVLDLDRYTVAYMVWTANKLSRGASHTYLKVFGVGVEVWRCLVLLAIHGSITAQQVSHVMGMDKAAVSRCFKVLQAKRLIVMGLNASDGRVRIATLTPTGRALHDQILEIALERERALLTVLSASERETLLRLLKRVHENLPAVEAATTAYVASRYRRAV
ncbi:MAG: MarR family transcriptional regulator [Pseudomonadota bacterium]